MNNYREQPDIKCCGNCMNHYIEDVDYDVCIAESENGFRIKVTSICDKWEKEND